MATNKHDVNANIEVNQGLKGMAMLCAAIAFGYASGVSGAGNPLVVGACAGAVAYAITFVSAAYGAGAVTLSVVVFAGTYMVHTSQAKQQTPATVTATTN